MERNRRSVSAKFVHAGLRARGIIAGGPADGINEIAKSSSQSRTFHYPCPMYRNKAGENLVRDDGAR